MIYESVMVLKYLPKVTLAYLTLAVLYGISISNVVLAVTIVLDILDYLPI